MATETLIQQLLDLTDDCIESPIDELLTNTKWGELDFEDCRLELERTYAMLEQYRYLPIRLLPEASIRKITSELIPIRDTISGIRTFTLNSSGHNPTTRRGQLVAVFKTQSDSFFEVSYKYFAYLVQQKGDFQQHIDVLTGSAEKAKKLIEQANMEMFAAKKEMASIIEAARTAAVTVGIGHFTEDFKDEAERQRGIDQRWLIAAVGLVIGTVVAAFCMGKIPIKVDATIPQVVQIFTSKAVILGALFTAMIWCGRQYRSAQHQIATNKHRANALRTFQAFTKAASDEETRNVVLLETTKSIFALTPSDYLDNEAASGNGVKVVEVVKHAARAAA